MSVWSAVSLAEGPTGLLQRDALSGRVAHAYLFSGGAGRLPMDAAVAFASALVCEKGGCGTCDTCRRTAHRAHPDVEIIEPAGVQLLVDQVREAVRAASRRPVAGPRRIIVVDGADRMNPTAQNAFLKALEEPPPSTTIILLAPSPEALLDTVRSRCREVTFRSPTPAEIASLLAGQGVEEAEAAYFARAGGSLERAGALASSPQDRELRKELVARVAEPSRHPDQALEAAEWLVSKTRSIRDRVAEDHKAKAEELAQWKHGETKRVADERLRREQRRAEQDALDAAIDDVASVLRDLVVLSEDPQAQVINTEVRAQLLRRASEADDEAQGRLIACLGDIEQCRRRLRGNANVLLTLEDVFLSIYRARLS